MWRLLLTAGVLCVLVRNSRATGSVDAELRYSRELPANQINFIPPGIPGYPKDAPSDPLGYFLPDQQTAVTGYSKESPSNPLTYPAPVSATGYPKESPAVPFTYPSPVTSPTPNTREYLPVAEPTGYPRESPERAFTYPERAPLQFSITTTEGPDRTTTPLPPIFLQNLKVIPIIPRKPSASSIHETLEFHPFLYAESHPEVRILLSPKARAEQQKPSGA